MGSGLQEKWIKQWHERFAHSRVTCKRCVYDETTPSITFDAEGICNYCRLHEQLNQEYPNGKEGEKILRQIASRVKKEGRNRKFDIVIGVSGGCDS